MSKMSLTQGAILKLEAGPNGCRYFDTKVPGLFLRVYPSGNRSYGVRKSVDRKKREKILGSAKIITLEQARDQAIKYLSAEAFGRPKQNDIMVSELAQKYMNSPKVLNLRQKTVENYQSLMINYILPRFGNGEVGKVTRGGVQTLLEEIATEGKGATSNAVRTLLVTLFEYAELHEHVDSNVVHKTEKVGQVNVRKRYLSDDEIGWLIDDLYQTNRKMDRDTRDCILLILFSGCRSGEVTFLRWEELNLDEKVWTLPAARSKSKRDQRIPLTSPMIEILKNRQVKSKGRVFEMAEKTATQWLKRVSTNTKTLTRKYDSPFYCHALRKTVSTNLSEKFGAADSLIERVLTHNPHSSGSLHHYNMHDFTREKVEVMTKWSIHLLETYPKLQEKIFNND